MYEKKIPDSIINASLYIRCQHASLSDSLRMGINGQLLHLIFLSTGANCGWIVPPNPVVKLTKISLNGITPDWGWYDSQTTITFLGNFSMQPGYRIINSTASFIGPTGSLTEVAGTAFDAGMINATMPSLNVIGSHCFELKVNIGTYASSNRFEITLGERYCFISSPRLGPIVPQFPQNGPPSGGTRIGFLFGMEPRTLAIGLECVWDDLRSPVSYTFPQDDSELIGGSCLSPTAGRNRYVCLQLRPTNTSYAMYPLLQTDVCDPDHSFPFSFYSQMPILDSIYPISGPATGGTVTVISGTNFPGDQESSGGSVRCLFGDSEVVGVRLNSSYVQCSGTPTPSGGLPNSTTNQTRVNVSLSFNSGLNFAPNPLLFIFVPTIVISRIVPENGISNGGTLIDVWLNTTTPSGIPLNGPRGVCFGRLIQVPLIWISDDLMHLKVTAPPATSGRPGTISLSVIQEDGTCGPVVDTGGSFTYHPVWAGTSVSVGVITGGETMLMNVSGSDFYSSPESACLATVYWPSSTGLDSSCNVTGDFTSVNNSMGTCALNLGSSLFDCGYPKASTVMNANPSQELLWDSMSANLAIAMNGRDFVTVTELENGLAVPATIRAVRLPIIQSLDPLVGFDYGGYLLEVNLQSGISWHVSMCVFTSRSLVNPRRVNVRANPFAVRAVACIVPQWFGEDQVDVQLLIVKENDVLSPPAVFHFLRSPEISSFYPREGPVSGNTDLTLFGSGFDQFASRLIVRPSFQCVFGQGKATSGRIVSSSEIHCKTPAVSIPGPVTLDLSLNWRTGASNKLSKTSLIQSVFLYTSSQLSLVSVKPLQGPIVGATDVVVTTLNRINVGGILRCIFGKVVVVGEFISESQFACKSPPVSSPGTVWLDISIDAQTSQSRLEFKFYRPPMVALILPAFGSTAGGTKILMEGSFFINSPEIVCRFGDKVVPVYRFISPQQIVCISPGGPLGHVPIAVSNNGVDFTSVVEDGFTFVETQPKLIMTPMIGPVTGGTRVLIKPEFGSLLPEIISSSIASGGPRCSFGSRSVGGAFTNTITGEIVCITPSVPKDGSYTVSVVYNGQESAFVGNPFRFHNVSTLTAIDPAMAPLGVPTTVTITGTNFINSETLTVRFGAPSVGYEDVAGVWISDTQIRCNPPSLSPAESILRVPVMVSNNGQDFVPSTINNWDPDDDSFADSQVAQYYVFHYPIVLHSVFPTFASIFGGGFISLYGGPFLKSSTLTCGFDRHVASVPPVFVSSTHILCPVPNLWAAGAPVEISVRLQVALVPNRWSDSFFEFTILPEGASAGKFTPHLNPSVWSSQPVECDPGYRCESSGLASPVQCSAGAYQPSPGRLQCLPCPLGHYCPHARMIAPIVCQGGWLCDEEGLVVPTKRCPPGYVCLEGTGSSDPVPDEPFVSLAPNATTNGIYRCLVGMYCLEGTAALVSMLGNFSTPQPCYQGYYCPPGSRSPFGSGGAPLGRFSSAPLYPGTLCPPRFYCGPVTGSRSPTPCPAGTYNGLAGQHNCTLAYEGSVSPAPLLSRPMVADCGYVAGRKGISAVTEADLCPAGTVCGFGTASDKEPKICIELSSANETQCDTSIGQVYFESLSGITTDRLDATAPHCCWNSALVVKFAQKIENIFASLPSGGAPLETLAARRFRQTIETLPSFDGKTLLDAVNRTSLIKVFKVNLERVRERILLEIERYFTFKSPDPCPDGVYCARGTCTRFASITNALVER